MLSRVADAIYWMSRYIERAENYARFVDVNFFLNMDLPKTFATQWQPLIGITGDELLFESIYGEVYSQDNVVEFLTFNKDNPSSILSCLIRARENARSIREIISSDMWRQINEMYWNVKDTNLTNNQDISEFFTFIKHGSHLFQGIMDSTLIHNEAYHFANCGRYIERADKISRILDMKYYYLLPSLQDVGTPLDYLEWSALLKSASAYEVYRKKYGRLYFKDIIQFLIFDREFPRAIYFCLLDIDKSLHTISDTRLDTFQNQAEKEMGRLISQLTFNDVEDVIRFGVHEYLDDFQTKLNHLGTAITQTFFGQARINPKEHV